MNPIKTPQEMLAEMAGIPHMASGSKVSPIAEVIAEYKRVHGKAPTPAEMRHLMLAYGKTPSKFAKGGAAIKRMAAPAAINAGLFAPELSAMGKNFARGKYGDVAGGMAGLALALAPYTPATVGLSLMSPNETGDATLDTWNKQKEDEARAYREYLRQTSPVFQENQPVDYIDFMTQLGYK
jgi:hypothetical protein